MNIFLLQRSIRRALRRATAARAACAMVGLAGLPLAGHAQDTAADSAASGDKLDTIVVTGSRIRSVDVETAQPLVIIDRAQIERSGFTSVGDILQNITATSGAAMTRSAVLVSNTFAGGSYVDIRGLGIQRALVLVNGHRWIKDVEAVLTDLSTIPKSMIERIEVLKDGASAIYGADAISGVVNIITRENYGGAEASAYYGQFDMATARPNPTMGRAIAADSSRPTVASCASASVVTRAMSATTARTRRRPMRSTSTGR